MPDLNRRDLLGASSIAAAAGLINGPARARSAPALTVFGLHAAQVVNPLGLEDRTPALSWRLAGERPAIVQTAWRIRVARSAERLRAGDADLWDSGRVESAVSTGVPYGGLPLISRDRAWWQVTVWDDAGESATSQEAAWWEAGLLQASDWSADWLAAESPLEKADRMAGMTAVAAPSPPEGVSRLFRLPFRTEAPGETVLVVFSSGFLKDLTVDGVAVDLPVHDRNAFGGPPAARLTVTLPQGDHMLAVEATRPRGFVGTEVVTMAAQIRSPAPGGGFLRLTEGWRTALSAPDGWRLVGAAEEDWSTPAAIEPQPIAPWPPAPAVQMRTEFTARPAIRCARLYVAALGACEIRLNGRPVADDRLQSETSDFRKTILYRAYDVGALLKPGANALAALVGDGWYASYMAPAGRYPFGPAPRRILAQLEIDLADGTRQIVTTGTDWRMAPSPILVSELYNGETYDARLETPGWDGVGFDDRGWTPCWTAETPAAVLKAQVSPPIRATQTLRAVRRTEPVQGRTVFDFGQNFAGLAKLSVKGRRGAVVTLRFAEVLASDGQVDQRNLRAAKATDTYILRGDPQGEVYLPHFTFHGFRYVQVEGLPANGTVEGVVIRSDLTETGTFRVANPLVQKLWLNTLWSQRSNFLAVPTDCPQRDERLGWTGDAQVFWDAAAFNMDVAAFTRRFLGDLRDAQSSLGAFPIFAPNPSPAAGASPGWADAGVMLPWICWRRYGDTTMLAEHWDAMTAYVDGVLKDNPDFLWRKVLGPNFGDWLSLDSKERGDDTTPKDLVATAMLKRSLDQLADMGRAIGKINGAQDYVAKADAVTRAFQSAFVRPDGAIGNESQTGYVLAIRLGLLTPEQKSEAGRRLTADIRRRGTLLSTGFIGTPLSLDALADIGATDLIYDLLLRSEFPSWGYMVSKGATTIWERWNADVGDPAMNSFNHYALGAVTGFLYRRIAGIEEIEPGFAKVRIAPLLDPRVPWGGGDYDSVRGRISTSWKSRGDGRLTLDAAIPANTTAEVHLPARPHAEIRVNGRLLNDWPDGVRLVERKPGGIVATTGSGAYRFTVW